MHLSTLPVNKNIPAKKARGVSHNKIVLITSKIVICSSIQIAPFLNWRTRLQPIRTTSEAQVKIIIQPLQRIPLYQKLAKKVEELLLLGMSFRAIAKSLGVNPVRNTKAIEEKNKISNGVHIKFPVSFRIFLTERQAGESSESSNSDLPFKLYPLNSLSYSIFPI